MHRKTYNSNDKKAIQQHYRWIENRMCAVLVNMCPHDFFTIFDVFSLFLFDRKKRNLSMASNRNNNIFLFFTKQTMHFSIIELSK